MANPVLVMGKMGFCWKLGGGFQKEAGREGQESRVAQAWDSCVSLGMLPHLSEHILICEVSLRWATVSLEVREDSP